VLFFCFFRQMAFFSRINFLPPASKPCPRKKALIFAKERPEVSPQSPKLASDVLKIGVEIKTNSLLKKITTFVFQSCNNRGENSTCNMLWWGTSIEGTGGHSFILVC